MPFISDAYYQALSPTKQDELLKTHMLLGYHPETHDHLCVPDTDRYAGTYLLGVQGCLHPDTPIFDPVDGTIHTVLERYVKGDGFNVLALDGQNVVIAKADAPLRYTRAPMYELSTGFNRIKVTGHHRIWDGSQYVECDVLYRLQGVLGVPLPTIADSDLSKLQSDIELSAGESKPYPYCPLSPYSCTNLYEITRIEDEVYYDFHVPQYENYYACGLFHHNTGKSGLLENMVTYDAEAGNAVIVLDAHGDLMTNCLATLPPHRLAQTYLLDMEDEMFPFGVNVFATGKLDTSLAHTQAVERIMHIFEVLWADVLSQQNLPRYVRAATITLLANPGTTLVDMYAMLINESYRTRLLANVTDASVIQFWKTNFEDLSSAEQLRRVQPLINRLEALFMGRSLVRNIVGQRVTTINFRQAIENREIIFIRLPVKTVAQDARLIGTMLMSQIHSAVFSFANVPEAKRLGVSLYIDEFQNFSTTDIAALFTEGRKFGMKLTVAHQYRNQLPGYLQDSTMTARTKVCFQLTPEDGREMAHIFPAQEEAIKPEDIEAHPVNHLLTYGSDDPVIQTFIEAYLRPLQSHKRGGKVDIDGSHLTFDLWNGVKQKNDLYVSDPTPYLDNLLYQAMRLHDPDLDIPSEVMWGFSNCGRGFFNAARRSFNRDLLNATLQYPPALVVPTNSGLQWTRLPESGMEQLYHFLFHLRMTMLLLAETPIGKKSTPSSTAVGQMLTNLPRRAAFVRSAETVGVIYTEDTKDRLQGRELIARIQAILTQTRKKYSHPRAEVERLFTQVGTTDTKIPKSEAREVIASPLPRWEEL